MTKLEQVARALAVHQFGNDDSWEDQVPMARVAVEALQEPNKRMLLRGIAGIGIIAIGVAAGCAFLFAVGETVEHFTR